MTDHDATRTHLRTAASRALVRSRELRVLAHLQLTAGHVESLKLDAERRRWRPHRRRLT
jgi:hypothetical protein